ncbi:MAG: type III pantothenate kinase [Balneola sp.]
MSKNDSSNSKKTLFLDIGNSSIKAGYKEKEEWIKASDNFKSITYLISWLNNHKDSYEDLVVASVRKDHFKLLENQIVDHRIQEILIENLAPERLSYSSPRTLGVDRYLGCLGAFKEAKAPVVVIDAGSACTIDYMDEKGIYQGGVIMPGLQSIIDVFKLSAPELPDIEIEIPSTWPGKTTAESLQWGQVGFFKAGIESALKRYSEQFGDFELFITGGDAQKISELIEGTSTQDEFLIFKGMEAFIKA